MLQVPSVVAFVHPSSSVFVQSTFETVKAKQIITQFQDISSVQHYTTYIPPSSWRTMKNPTGKQHELEHIQLKVRCNFFYMFTTVWFQAHQQAWGRTYPKCQAKTVVMSWQNVKTSIHSAHRCKQAVGSLSNKKLWLLCTCHHRFHSQERSAREALKLWPRYQHCSNRLGLDKTQKPPKGKRYSLHGRPGGGQYHRPLWAFQIAFGDGATLKKWFRLGGQANSRPIL